MTVAESVGRPADPGLPNVRVSSPSDTRAVRGATGWLLLPQVVTARSVPSATHRTPVPPPLPPGSSGSPATGSRSPSGLPWARTTSGCSCVMRRSVGRSALLELVGGQPGLDEHRAVHAGHGVGDAAVPAVLLLAPLDQQARPGPGGVGRVVHPAVPARAVPGGSARGRPCPGLRRRRGDAGAGGAVGQRDAVLPTVHPSGHAQMLSRRSNTCSTSGWVSSGAPCRQHPAQGLPPPHGMQTTEAATINADLLAFLQS